MRNDKGYAIIVVMLILGLIGILAVGLLTMTRVDTSFTGAAKNYDMLFNLADGACSIAYNDLVSQERTNSYTGTAASGRIGPLFNQLAENPIGSYSVYEVLQGYNTNTPPGYEIGQGEGVGYFTEQWTGEGHASRYVGALMVEAAIQKTLTK